MGISKKYQGKETLANVKSIKNRRVREVICTTERKVEQESNKMLSLGKKT